MSADHDAKVAVLGAQHVGFTVPDIDEAIAFFEDALGAETLAHVGRIDADGAWYVGHLGVDPSARIERMALLRIGTGTNLELFEYSADGQRRAGPANSDVGGHHIGFQVRDIAAAAAALRARGVDVLEGPSLIEDGDLAGLRWIYFQAPWGMTLELVQIDGPLGHEARTGTKLWSPAD